MKHYTGVGSRETPPEILELMTKVARMLARGQWTLRTGGAVGADQAFELGWVHDLQNAGKALAEIYLPWEGYEKHSRDMMFGCNILPCEENPEKYLIAEEMAAAVHPNWGACKQGARKLHTRNVYQVLGRNLKTPSKFLLAWTKLTKAGNPTGGTATAIRLAESYDIPCFNLAIPAHLARVQTWVQDGQHKE